MAAADIRKWQGPVTDYDVIMMEMIRSSFNNLFFRLKIEKKKVFR